MTHSDIASDARPVNTPRTACVAMYSAGPEPCDPAVRNQLWEQHLNHLDNLHRDGQLLLAGLFEEELDGQAAFAVFRLPRPGCCRGAGAGRPGGGTDADRRDPGLDTAVRCRTPAASPGRLGAGTSD